MRDKGRIIVGLVVFVVLVTYPLWNNLGAAENTSPPELALPKDKTHCIEEKEYMTANHMDLLNKWRDAVVRNGDRYYTSQSFGERYEMSLTKTCMNCHNDREKFCIRCHDYANVQPSCWGCHVEPKETE